MDSLTINEAARTSGWSPRMLRYVETLGLVEPGRSAGGYRLYGAAELQRLRTLRELLDRYGLDLGDVGVVRRMRHEQLMHDAVEEWLDAEPVRPDDVPAADWLQWEQDKHERLLAEARPRDTTTRETR